MEPLVLEKAREKKETPLYTVAKGSEILTAFDQQFKEVETHYEVIDSEIKFVVTVPGCSLPIHMVIDLVLLDTEVRKYLVAEFKFSSSIWRFCDDPNDQGVGYAVGASQKLGVDISRIIYHISEVKLISTNGIIPARKKGDLGRSIFKRSIIDLDPWDVEEWYRDMQNKVDEVVRYTDASYWPKRTRSCGEFGGCQFIPLCTAPDALREVFARSNFDVEAEEDEEWMV